VRCLVSCAVIDAKGSDCCILLASDLWDWVVGVFGVVVYTAISNSLSAHLVPFNWAWWCLAWTFILVHGL
jgi:hypothetical protein